MSRVGLGRVWSVRVTLTPTRSDPREAIRPVKFYFIPVGTRKEKNNPPSTTTKRRMPPYPVCSSSSTGIIHAAVCACLHGQLLALQFGSHFLPCTAGQTRVSSYGRCCNRQGFFFPTIFLFVSLTKPFLRISLEGKNDDEKIKDEGIGSPLVWRRSKAVSEVQYRKGKRLTPGRVQHDPYWYCCCALTLPVDA